MPPQLVLAAPLTPIFKGLVSHLPWLDDKFHSGTFLLCDRILSPSLTESKGEISGERPLKSTQEP